MKIGEIEFNNPIILAPMAGVTDVGFRTVCAEYGADATVTEMISAKGLIYDSEKTKSLLMSTPVERIKVVQIFGHEPKVMAEAVVHKELENFDIIDINMGCPAPKIVNNGDGSALMKNMPLAEEIIRACVAVSKKPITVKFRSGWSEDSVNAVEFAKMCERAGASAITIHARTREQFYSGNVSYDIISQVKQAVKIPVIGNGDVFDKESYEKMLATGVDGVMVARGSLGRPYIFAELKNKKFSYNAVETLKKHYSLACSSMGERVALNELRKHFAWYLKGVTNVSKFRIEILKAGNFEKVIEILNEAYNQK